MMIRTFSEKRHSSNPQIIAGCVALLYAMMMFLPVRPSLAIEPGSSLPVVPSESREENSALEMNTAASDPTRQSGIIGITIDSSPASVADNPQGGSLFRIDQVIDGTSAKAVGLKSGDIIVAIDSAPTSLLTLKEVVEKLRGKAGTSVRIEVRRNEETLDFTCTRTNPSDSVHLQEFQACLQHFEKNGFGMRSLAWVGTLASSDSATKEHRRDALIFLDPRSKKLAKKYLMLPAAGQWTGPEVDTRYKRFERALTAKDKSTSSYHFIKATYLFGHGNYSECVKELEVCIQKYASLAVAYRLRALALSKLGNFVAAQQDWLQGDRLIVPMTESPDVWLNGTLTKLKRNWHHSRHPLDASTRQVVAIVTVERDGRISRVQITQSSGDKQLDRSVERACMTAPLLDPPPLTLASPALVQVTFESKVLRRERF